MRASLCFFLLLAAIGLQLPVLSVASTPIWSVESNQTSAHLGKSVATAGDVNGDGYDDLLVGIPDYDDPDLGEGQAQLFLGGAAGPAPTPAWTFELNQAGAAVGICWAPAGDVNGDGFGDWLVGANLYDNGQNNEGAVFVFHGGAGSLSTTPATTLESNSANALFGFSATTAGDVNGDGYDDVVVGAYTFTNGQNQEGKAFLFQGSATGVNPTAAWSVESNQATANFGYSVSSAGDVDGDQFADVLVGAYRYDNPTLDEGAVFLYRGGA